MRVVGRFVALAVVASGLALLSAAPPASAGVLTQCTEAAFRDAVAAGGTVTWASDCTLAMTSPLTIPSGLTVTIDGGVTDIGSSARVRLDWGGRSRAFNVTGGTLTLRNIVVAGGKVTGAAGLAGPTRQKAGTTHQALLTELLNSSAYSTRITG